MRKIQFKLIEAAREGSVDEVKRCLSVKGCDAVASRSVLGATALMLASINGHEECVKILLPHSDALAQDGGGFTALMAAAGNGLVDCVRLLLPWSDPLATNNSGYSALMCAADGGHEACVKLLLLKSNLLSKNKRGDSASQVAWLSGHWPLAEMIETYVLSMSEKALISEHLPQNLVQGPARRMPTLRM